MRSRWFDPCELRFCVWMHFCLRVYKWICLCLSSVFLWFSGFCRILVTRQTSEIYSGCPAQQPDSNSSSSRGKECRLSGGLGRMIGDPVGGSGDAGSPVSWVERDREREKGVEGRRGKLDWGPDTHESKEGAWWWWWCWRGLKVFGSVPVEPAFWHATFQEINTMVFPFTPPPTHIHHPAVNPNASAAFFFFFFPQ